MFYLLLLLIVLFLMSSFTIKIKNIKNETDVILSFGFIVKIHLDYDNFIERFNFLKSPQNLTVSQINGYIKQAFVSKKFAYDLAKRVKILKFNIFKIINLKNKTVDPYADTMFYIFTGYISSIMRSKFFLVKEEKYEIVRNDFGKQEFDFEIWAKINIFKIIIVSIKNMSSIIKIIKINRSAKKNGSSNTYTA